MPGPDGALGQSLGQSARAARPLLLRSDTDHEAMSLPTQRMSKAGAPLFYFDYACKHLLPIGTTGSLREGNRLVRSEIWAKHGEPMHFLTLEFEDEAIEVEFMKDTARRTKRWVEYGVVGMCVWNFAMACLRWVTAYINEVLPYSGANCAVVAAVLYFLQYLQLRFDREFVMRNLQPVLFCWSLLQMTTLLAFYTYISPDEYREISLRSGTGEAQYLQENVMNCLVITFIAYRMSYFYFLIFTCYAFFSFCILMRFDVDHAYLFWFCAGFSFLSYTMEILQRKDFIQATMVWKESRRSQLLLSNILPGPIIEELKQADGRQSIARSYAAVTVLFADVVSFTTMSAQISPLVLVELLNRMFRGFDDLADKIGIEKIKTIGDCYMAAAGLPVVNQDHANTMARFGLRMLELMDSGVFKNPASGEPIRVRAGMHSGPCVAGVIGHKKFAYDIWGDAVNTASRMESHGEPMRLHCSGDTRLLLGDDFICEALEPMKVKGKGEMQTYFVNSEVGGDFASTTTMTSSSSSSQIASYASESLLGCK